MKLSDKTIQEIAELYNETPADTRQYVLNDRQYMLNEDWGELQNNWLPFYKLRRDRWRKLLEVLNADPSMTPVVEYLPALMKWAPHPMSMEAGRVYRIHEDLECPDITASLNEPQPAGDRWVIEDDKLFLTASERHMVPDPMSDGNLERHICNPADQLQTPNGRRWVRACWWVWSNYDQKLLVSSPVLHREGTAITPYLIDGKNIKSADICWVDGVVYLPE